MAQVPFTPVPSVLPTAMPDNYNRVQATPGDFGAQTAQAIGQVGAAFDQSSGDLGQVALQKQAIVNQTAGDHATNDLLMGQQKLMFGDPSDPSAPPGFMSLSGQAAVLAAPKVQEQMASLRDQIGSTLTNPIQKVNYQRDSLFIFRQAFGQLNDKVAQEQDAYQKQTAAATVQNAVNLASQTPNDLGAVQASAQKVVDTTNMMAVQQGWSPEMTKATQAANMGTFVTTVARARAASGDVAGALAFLDSNRANIPAQDYTDMTDTLKPKINEAQGQALATAALNGHGTGGYGAVSSTADNGSIFNAMTLQESGNRQANADGTPVSSGVDGADAPIGVAQIKPSTAQAVAEANGIAWDPNRLKTGPAYNRALGEDYLNQMMSRYGGNKTLAVAAYSAGPANVDAWIKQNGDPRTGAISDTQFVQSIPFAETKNYVSRVAATTGTKLTGQQTQLADASSSNGTATDAGGDLPSSVNAALGVPSAGPSSQASASSYTPRPDFEGAANRVVSTGASDDVTRVALNELRRQKTTWDAQNSANVSALSAQAQNLYASYQNGNTAADVPIAQIRSLLPAEQAQTMIDRLMVARQDGQAFKSVQYGSLQDIAEARATVEIPGGIQAGSIKAGKGGIVGPGVNGAPGAVEDQDRVQQRMEDSSRLEGMISTRNAALAADPAGFAATNPALAPLAQAAQAAPDDPNARQAYATALMADQARMGVQNPRMLSNAQVATEVNTLTKADPSKGDVGVALDSLAQKYGPLWPQVFGEMVKYGKIDPDYQTLATMDQPSQIGRRADFQRSLMAGSLDQIKKAADPQVIKNVDSQLQSNSTLASFRDTTTGQSGGIPLMNMVTDSVTRLAYYYASQGQSANAAVQNATNGILNDKYDFSGTMRVPKGMMPNVNTAIVNVMGALKPTDLLPIATAPGLTPADAQNTVWQSAKADGQWYPNADDSGLVMLRPLRNGGMVPVKLTSGKPLEIKFSDAAKLAGSSPGAFTLSNLTDALGGL